MNTFFTFSKDVARKCYHVLVIYCLQHNIIVDIVLEVARNEYNVTYAIKNILAMINDLLIEVV